MHPNGINAQDNNVNVAYVFIDQTQIVYMK